MNSKVSNKIASALTAAVILFGLSTVSAKAINIGFGGSFGGTWGEVSGTETMNQSGDTEKATEGIHGALASGYVELTVGEGFFGENNGFVLGYENFFGDASIEEQRSDQRSDLIVGNATSLCITKAEGKLEKMRTVYLETPGFTPLGIYLMAGISDIDVITEEELFTGGEYGNMGVDGETYGFGFKKAAGMMHIKSEFKYTDWDSFSLSNTGNANAILGAEKISVDSLENWSFQIKVGYQF